jgi:replication initiation and membrane attachment protein
MGSDAFTLYTILQALLDRQSLTSLEYLHADLESLLNKKLSDIETARYRLEAIGLMNTCFLDDRFLYELKLPMSAQSFVNDGILGQYLQSALTKDRFKKLVQIFRLKPPKTSGYLKITKSFDEVFPALFLSESVSEENLITNHRGKQVSAVKATFDWRLFANSIPAAFFDPAELTDSLKNKIKNLHYVYGLDELEMKDITLKAMDDNRKISSSQLAVYAREYYKARQQSLLNPSQTAPERTFDRHHLSTDPIEYFQQVTPRVLLEEMGGGQVSAADLRIVERLIEEVGLDEGVVNVLIAYVAKIKDGHLPGYDYFEKVAMSWKHNQIHNVKEAIDYVQHLKAKYERAQKEGKPSFGKSGKPKRPDVEIDWLDDYIKSL